MEGIRPAEQSDADRCHELLRAALAATAGHRGAALLLAATPDLAQPETLFEQWLTDGHVRVFVGTYDEVVVGLGAGRVVQLGDYPVGRIECLFVEPDARSVGVGEAIVDGLVHWFASKGCTDVDAVALPGDRSSKQLLESAGFRARLLVLHRPLD